MAYKTELQSNNTDLQTVLSKVNALPSGAALGDATAADVVAGKTFSSASGIKVSGTLVPMEVVTGRATVKDNKNITGLPTGKNNLVLYVDAERSSHSSIYSLVILNGSMVICSYYRNQYVSKSASNFKLDTSAGTLWTDFTIATDGYPYYYIMW